MALKEVWGVIGERNETGLRWEDSQAWVNVSKYAQGVVIPPSGTKVRVGLDKAGYIRTLERLSASASADPTPAPTPTETDSEVGMRTVALNAAVTLLTSERFALRNGTAAIARPSDVLALADYLLVWLAREDER